MTCGVGHALICHVSLRSRYDSYCQVLMHCKTCLRLEVWNCDADMDVAEMACCFFSGYLVLILYPYDRVQRLEEGILHIVCWEMLCVFHVRKMSWALRFICRRMSALDDCVNNVNHCVCLMKWKTLFLCFLTKLMSSWYSDTLKLRCCRLASYLSINHACSDQKNEELFGWDANSRWHLVELAPTSYFTPITALEQWEIDRFIWSDFMCPRS